MPIFPSLPFSVICYRIVLVMFAITMIGTGMAQETPETSPENPAETPAAPSANATPAAAAPTAVPGGNARGYTDIYPIDAVLDRNENLWVVDLNGHAVWKVEQGVPKIQVQGSNRHRQPLNRPRCLAFSPLSPVGGTPEGDSTQHLFVGDTSTREVYKIIEGSEPIPMVAGKIGVPMDLAFSQDGTLFIADLEQRAIWQLKPGASSPEIYIANANARGLFVDGEDRLWVVSQNAEQLVRYDRDRNPTVLVASRTFEFPHQVVVDSQGVAWISDGYKKCIWKFKEGAAPEIAITSPLLQNPVGMLLYQDRPAVVDSHAMAVFKTSVEYQIEEWIRLK